MKNTDLFRNFEEFPKNFLAHLDFHLRKNHQSILLQTFQFQTNRTEGTYHEERSGINRTPHHWSPLTYATASRVQNTSIYYCYFPLRQRETEEFGVEENWWNSTRRSAYAARIQEENDGKVVTMLNPCFLMIDIAEYLL